MCVFMSEYEFVPQPDWVGRLVVGGVVGEIQHTERSSLSLSDGNLPSQMFDLMAHDIVSTPRVKHHSSLFI